MEGFLGIGGNELFLILLFAFLIFGPDKLPEIARTVGRAIAKFRDAQNEVNEVIKQEVYDPAADQDNPLGKAAEKAGQMNKQPENTETFAERKARYDKIRAERKAREDAAREAARKQVEADRNAAGEPAAGAATPDEPDIDELLGVSKPSSAAPADAPGDAEPQDAAAGSREGGDA